MLAASGRSPSEAGLRAPATLPEWAGVAGLAAAALASRWDQLTGALGWQPACAVRARLGVPCPLCGGTTAAIELADGDPASALAASPLAVALAAVAIVGLVLYALRLAGRLPPPGDWPPATQRLVAAVLALALLLSWAYQLTRLGTG